MPEWLIDLASRLPAEEDLAEARRFVAAGQAGGSDGAEAVLKLARLVGEAGEPVETIRSLPDGAEDAAGALAAIVVHVFAALRIDYAAQPDAVAARQAIVERGGRGYGIIGIEAGSDALDFAVRLVGEAALQLSRIAATRAPLVRVETNISLPSSLVAWDLYGDPSRGAELAGRNGWGAPMLLPSRFVALAR